MENKAEIWRLIPNHSRYEISTYGRVRHIRHKRILKQSRPHNGYLQVGVYSDILNKRISKCVHHLMALTFLGKKLKGFEVAHQDNNKENNYLSNLYYLLWQQNRPKKTLEWKKCPICDKEIPPQRKHCSRYCEFLGTYTPLKCEICGKQFWRRNSQIKAASVERGYAFGRTYCSRLCYNQISGQEMQKKRWRTSHETT